MKILLVYPEFPDTYWSFNHALKFEGKRSAFPPLGLLTILAMLPPAWERRLIDTNVRRLTPTDIEWADMVFLSAMIVQKESLREVVSLCTARGKRVVVGGPYVTTSTANVPEADHVFVGEAETTLSEFARDLERGDARRVYKAAERPSLELTPIPDFGLADLKSYSFMSLQYSRGCPFSCEFCDIIEIYGRVPRTKSNGQVIAELDALRTAGWRGEVLIVDDNFIGNKRNVRALLPELIDWSEQHNRPFPFVTEASVNLADDDCLLEMMRRAGAPRSGAWTARRRAPRVLALHARGYNVAPGEVCGRGHAGGTGLSLSQNNRTVLRAATAGDEFALERIPEARIKFIRSETGKVVAISVFNRMRVCERTMKEKP